MIQLMLTNFKGPTEPLQPPRRASLPLWLALLLKRQRRANILPPSWLHPEALSLILEIETKHQDYKDAFSPPPRLPGQPSVYELSAGAKPKPVPRRTLDGQQYFPTPPFLPQNVAMSSAEATERSGDPPALPYHWLEVGTMLLDAASDDLVDPDQIRRLLKDLREVRMAKMRKGVDVLDAAATITGGGGIAMTGVGAMEIGEGRGFVAGVVEGLRYVSFLMSNLCVLSGKGCLLGDYVADMLGLRQENRSIQRTSAERTAGRRAGEQRIRRHPRLRRRHGVLGVSFYLSRSSEVTKGRYDVVYEPFTMNVVCVYTLYSIPPRKRKSNPTENAVQDATLHAIRTDE